MPQILWYYNRSLLKDLADDKMQLWTMPLTEYVFLACLQLVINAKDGAYASY